MSERTTRSEPATLSEHVARTRSTTGSRSFRRTGKRSAVIAALRAVAARERRLSHAASSMDAVAEYLRPAADPGVRGRDVLLDVRDQAGRPAQHLGVHEHLAACCAAATTSLAHVEKRLGIKAGESTPDGKFYLKREEECLAACSDAPMMMVDHVYSREPHARRRSTRFWSAVK